MYIDNETSIKNIQQAFNDLYPLLWIDFYYKRKNRTVFHSELKISADKRLKEFMMLKQKSLIDVNGERTVNDLKRELESLLNVEVHILRKAGNVWIGTSLTQDWTLNHQSQAGGQELYDKEKAL